MKKYKSIIVPILAYVAAVLLFFVGLYFVTSIPRDILLINYFFSVPAIILVLYGIFSSFKSIKSNKVGWIGYVVILLGFAMLIYLTPLIFSFLLAFTPI